MADFTEHKNNLVKCRACPSEHMDLQACRHNLFRTCINFTPPGFLQCYGILCYNNFTLSGLKQCEINVPPDVPRVTQPARGDIIVALCKCVVTKTPEG